jgi:hypothetical protein
MRRPFLTLTLLLALLALPMLPMLPLGGHVAAVATALSGTVLHAQVSSPATHVDITVGHGGSWHAAPVWIAVGAIGLVVLILLIVMASRGGGGTTTVVK